jgi:hypothetical protein
MNEIEKQRNRIAVRFGLIGAGFCFIVAVPGVLNEIFSWNLPYKAFLNSKTYLIGGTVLFYVLASLYERTNLFKRNGAILKAYLKVAAYNRAEKKVESGIYWGSAKRVKKGLECLAELDSWFSEMPEYRELQDKGRAWLVSKEQQNA